MITARHYYLLLLMSFGLSVLIVATGLPAFMWFFPASLVVASTYGRVRTVNAKHKELEG